MERDGFTCQQCGAVDKTLHVHHHKYAGKPWEVDEYYLETLCEDCHLEIEKLKVCVAHMMTFAEGRMDLQAAVKNRMFAHQREKEKNTQKTNA